MAGSQEPMAKPGSLLLFGAPREMAMAGPARQNLEPTGAQTSAWCTLDAKPISRTTGIRETLLACINGFILDAKVSMGPCSFALHWMCILQDLYCDKVS